MRMTLLATGFALALLAAPVLGAPAGDELRVIKVLGVGSVDTPPDVATISIDIRGEGKTADAATRDLVDKQAAITRGLEQYRNAQTDLKTGTVSIRPARGPDCDEDEFDDRVQLSTGKCATAGYVAQNSLTFRTTAVADAGTIVGLASRLGATAAEIADFGVRDPKAARAQALSAAVANGRTQAEAIAAASSGRIGRLVRVEAAEARGVDEEAIVVTAQVRANIPQVMEPIPVVVAPRPITTRAELVMTFEILP